MDERKQLESDLWHLTGGHRFGAVQHGLDTPFLVGWGTGGYLMGAEAKLHDYLQGKPVLQQAISCATPQSAVDLFHDFEKRNDDPMVSKNFRSWQFEDVVITVSDDWS